MTTTALFGVRVLVGLYSIGAALVRIHGTLKQATEWIPEIAESVEAIRRDVERIPNACLEIGRLRRHLAGSTDGEKTKALAEWDRENGA